jgi:hypothetical protein
MIGARTPVDTATVAAPSPAMNRRRPGDLGAPSDSRAFAGKSAFVPDCRLLEISLAITAPLALREEY